MHVPRRHRLTVPPVPPPSSPPTPAPETAGETGADPQADRMLAAARRGSNRAWAALVERLDPRCRALAHVVLGGHAVDDALLSAYVRAYRARRRGSDEAVVFLVHHVWIACGHEIRRRQRREAPAPGRKAVRDDRPPRLGDDPLGRAVADLRPEERAVWSLVSRDGVPAATAAEALGVDERVVATVADRVESRLAEAVDATAAHDTLGSLDPGTDDDTDGVAADDDDDAADGADLDAEPGRLDPDPPTPEFWQALGARLRAERDALPAAPRPPLPEPGAPATSLTAAKAPPVAMQKRPSRRSRRRRPDRVDELVDEVGRQKPRRRWGALLVRAAAVIVVLGVLAAAVIVLYRAASRASSPPRGDTVAEVAARSMEVLDDAGTWSASVEVTALDDTGAVQSSSLTLTAAADGSYRIQDSTLGRLTTYDATFGVVMDTIGGFPPRHDTGVAPGPPDTTAPRAGLPLDDLGIAVRTLAAVDDEEPRSEELNGRAVLELSAPLADDMVLTYTVDEESLAPVRIAWTLDGTALRELRFADVQLGVPPAEYAQELPADAPATDLGFARVRLTEVAGRTELQPLTPDYLPDGFTFTGAAVNERQRIASTRYARGPQELIITLRPSPVEAGRPWDDPFERGASPPTSTDLPIEAGPFRGTTASMVSGGTDLPSVWGADGELAFTVAGDLSPDELVRVAQSLRQA